MPKHWSGTCPARVHVLTSLPASFQLLPRIDRRVLFLRAPIVRG
jgi:hypothetical protein